MRAIISVFDKTAAMSFARGLTDMKVEIFSTGGTKRELTEAGVEVHSISELTGFPEILDGRVKTLHPAVHGGILAKRGIAEHMSQLADMGIGAIDLVAVNLYPFRQTVAKAGTSLDEALENIDIGGPTMIRAAAKSFPDVIVIVDPADYDPVLEGLRKGKITLKERQRLAQKAFQHVASYDTAIAQYLRCEEEFPEEMTIALKKRSNLSYGENPHQQAAFYLEDFPTGQALQKEVSLVSAEQLHGKALSFNNILDLDAAIKIVAEFPEPTVAIIKHNNPCGLATYPDMAEAYRRALAGDPLAAFGGVVSLNRRVDMAAATEIYKTHYDAIIAPQYDADALSLLQRKRDLRILSLNTPQVSVNPSVSVTKKDTYLADLRRVRGGFLMQTPDFISEKEMHPRTVTQREPTEAELENLLFAWQVVKSVKSNAIVIAKDGTLLGMGAGQPSRVVSVELALQRAADSAKGGVLASDAFFPFPDGVEVAARGGVTAIIQPGGSVKDGEVINAANQYNIAMVFTGARHFRH